MACILQQRGFYLASTSFHAVELIMTFMARLGAFSCCSTAFLAYKVVACNQLQLASPQTLAMRRLRLGRPKLKPPSIATLGDDSALLDVLRTSLYALKESASAFSPLQSAVGGALALWDIAEVRLTCIHERQKR